MEQSHGIGQGGIGDQHVVDDGQLEIGGTLASRCDGAVESAEIVVDDRLACKGHNAPVGRELIGTSRPSASDP